MAQSLVDEHFESTAPFWKDIYDRQGLYGTLYRQRRDVALSFVDGLAIPPGALVLEIGCGAGLVSIAFAQRGFVVHAIDIAPGMIDATRRRAYEAGFVQRVNVSLADGRYLPFGAGRFALVVCLGVLQWMPSLAPAIFEIARVLAPGGHCVLNLDNRWAMQRVLDPMLNPIVVPAKRAVYSELERLGFKQPRARPRANSRREIDAVLAGAGLSKLRSGAFGFGPFTLLGRRLLPEPAALRAHHSLQSLADRGVPLLRSAGHYFMVMARKP